MHTRVEDMNDKMAARWREWKVSMEACRSKYGGNGHVFNMNKQPDTENLICEKCGMKIRRGWLYENENEKE